MFYRLTHCRCLTKLKYLWMSPPTELERSAYRATQYRIANIACIGDPLKEQVVEIYVGVSCDSIVTSY